VLFPFWIKLENIQSVLGIDVIVQINLMCDLIFFLDQVEFLPDRRVVLISVFPNLEQNFDHVLCSFVDIGLVQNAAKLVKYSQRYGLAHFLQVLSYFSRQADGDFHRVVRRFVEK
jgi:hypothetical protein